MKKNHTKMFWLFVIMDFLFHFFYLLIPGIVLCIIGIWLKPCLWIGLVLLGIDMILSILKQLRVCNASGTHSDNHEFNELMDAFYGPDGINAVRKIVSEKIKVENNLEEDV